MAEPRADRMYVACKACSHIWVAAHLPMPMAKLAKILKHCHCPHCGCGPAGILMASKEQALAYEATQPANPNPNRRP